MTRETETAHGEARLNLCHNLAEALTTATGDLWTRDDSRVYQGEGWRDSGLAHDFRGSAFVRQRDGFTIRATGPCAYNKPDRMAAAIDWPKNPVESGGYAVRRYRDAPGVDWNQPEPGCTFAADRPAKAVARQIVRELTKPEHVAAWAALERLNAEAVTTKDTATAWREAVGEALGQPLAFSEVAGRIPGLSDYCNPVGLSLTDETGKRPGGVASVRLPEDPAAAARIVAAIRAAVLAENAEG